MVSADDVKGKRINHPSNGFLGQANIHTQYDRFCFSIRADTSMSPVVYRIHCFRELGPTLNQKAAQGAPLQFGRADFHHLPNPALCNLHYSIGRVLRASGAAEVIDKILKDEEELREPGAPFSTVPASGEHSRETFYLERRLAGSVGGGRSEEEEEEGEE